MKRLIAYLFTFLWVLNSFSQEFGTHWIAYPLPNDSSEVFFRHTYVTKTFPQQAYIHINSTGKYRLYVNERNVSRNLMTDGMHHDTLTAQTFDICQHLRSDSNTIAVWYAPDKGFSEGKQLSLEYYGIDAKGNPFYHQADGEWVCRLIPGSYAKGDKESFNAQVFRKDWNSTEYKPIRWLHPTGSFSSKSLEQKESTWLHSPYKLERIIHPINTYTDSLGHHIDFGRAFFGTVRLTLRGARRGTVININDYQYTCKGESDEQAFPRFRYKRQRVFTIPDNKIKPENITNIEGLEITTPPFN